MSENLVNTGAGAEADARVDVKAKIGVSLRGGKASSF